MPDVPLDGGANNGLLVPLTIAWWIAFAGWFFMEIASLASKLERYFLFRLWPAYATDHVVVKTSYDLEAGHTESRS
ncbi:MAG: hypothetical protein ABI238_06055 [Terrimesophilobacter sp.]